GKKWNEVFSGESSGVTDSYERYSLEKSEKVSYIRVSGQGNSVNKWNSISEFKVNAKENIKSASEHQKAKDLEMANAKDYVSEGEIFWNPKIDENWEKTWNIMGDKRFGLKENLEVVKDGADNVFRVKYPKGSIAPNAVENLGAPLGGAQFYVNLEGRKSAELSYMLKFSPNFDFAKGGKIPGFYGGDRNASGKRMPTEDSGFSTRMMWRENGSAYIYAYLPSSSMHGTYLGRWQFEKNRWHKISQRVYLNEAGKSDGKIEIYLDGKLVTEIKDLKFRNGENLKIDGLFFSTFFGGSDKSWASRDNVYMDYKNFEMREVK
ncbi:MAG: polysaccharide lyase, partial [Fusobacteriaceae bacterium]